MTAPGESDPVLAALAQWEKLRGEIAALDCARPGPAERAARLSELATGRPPPRIAPKGPPGPA